MPPPASRPVRIPAESHSRRPIAPSVHAIQELGPMPHRSAMVDSRFTQPEEPGYLADVEHSSYRLPQDRDEPQRPDERSMQMQRKGFTGHEDGGATLYDDHSQRATSRRALQPRQHGEIPGYNASQVTQYDSAYGTAQDQRETQSRAPLRLHPITQDTRSFSMKHTTGLPLQQRGLSPAKSGHGPPGSVISPFFSRAKHALLPEATTIPPTRGSMMSGISNFYSAPNTAQARPESRMGRPFVVESASQQSQPSPFVRPMPPSRYQQSTRYAPPSRSFELPYRQSTAVPPTPRLRPPATGPASYQPSRNGSTANGAYRNRITLPPSPARHHDYELTSAPGLRGSHNDAAHTQRGLVYADSRPLFSVAGRRSVRR